MCQDCLDIKDQASRWIEHVGFERRWGRRRYFCLLKLMKKFLPTKLEDIGSLTQPLYQFLMGEGEEGV
jgi:hypothetical protein